MLGIERRHADALAEMIKTSLPRAPAQSGVTNEYGQSWTTFHEIIGVNGKSGIITVGWMFLNTEPAVPKLVTCYIDANDQTRLGQLVRSE